MSQLPATGPLPARDRRSARGGGRGLKLGLAVVGGLALVMLIAIGAEKLPSLSQINLTTLMGQGTSTNPPDTNQTPSTSNPNSAGEHPVANPPLDSQAPVEPLPEVKPARPESDRTRPPQGGPKPPQRSNREMAADEFDTDRGRELFAQVKRVVIAREGQPNKNQDPRGAVWKETAANCRHMLEKLGLDVSTGAADRDAAVLTISLDLQPSKKGTPGTKEIRISAELTCADPTEDDRSLQYAKVWKAEQDLGTISAKSSKAGKLPNSVEDQIATFFGKFRGAYRHAVQAVKATENTDATE